MKPIRLERIRVVGSLDSYLLALDMLCTTEGAAIILLSPFFDGPGFVVFLIIGLAGIFGGWALARWGTS